MNARVIPFPARTERPSAQMAVGAGPIPAPEPVGQACAEICLRLGSPVDERLGRPEAAQAAVVALLEAGAEVRLAGTGTHLIVEATMLGPDASARAAAAALEADHAVRAASGNRTIVSGAVCSGHLVALMPGVTRRVGFIPAGQLAERAAPGQILVGGSAWERESAVEVIPARNADPVPVSVLRGLR